MKNFYKVALVELVLATIMTDHATAKVSLVSSTPEANAVVTERPPQIELRFSEKIGRINVTVRGPRGRQITTTVGVDQYDRSQVFVSFWDRLTRGRYSVRWSVVSLDKRRSQGTYSFTVKAG